MLGSVVWGTRLAGAWNVMLPGETETRGAGRPATVSVVPAREVGKGEPVAERVLTARFSPKMVKMQPGASSGPLAGFRARLAEFTMLSRWIYGC